VVVVFGISIQLTPSTLYCQDIYTTPLPPLAVAVNDTVPKPSQPVAFAGGTFPRLIGAPTARVKTFVVAVPQKFVYTARYFFPSSLGLVLKV